MAGGWTAASMPRLTGTVAVVTGANSGLGLESARALARAGAHVVMACRSVEKGERAAATLRDEGGADGGAGGGDGGGDVEVRRLDLADLASVATFAEAFDGALHLLVCNAGVMAPPRRLTVDGFESQLGCNHLGHFALVARLMPALMAGGASGLWPGGDARVVSLSSLAHRMGWIHWNDLNGERHYNSWLWYGQSKLATLMFAFELARRLGVAGAPVRSLAAHPGYAATNLQFAGPRPWESVAFGVLNRLVAQGAAAGALPSLYAATVADLPSGAFVGPDGVGEMRGHPRIVGAAARASDEAAGRRLWEVSEELTGVALPFPSGAELAQN